MSFFPLAAVHHHRDPEHAVLSGRLHFPVRLQCVVQQVSEYDGKMPAPEGKFDRQKYTGVKGNALIPGDSLLVVHKVIHDNVTGVVTNEFLRAMPSYKNDLRI